uniref:Protein phosphatase 1 regulatory subunit 12C-like n=1 Tax=Neolamprologus brichardi TaxID=32507 RepID=A0A3Q4HPH7_NEOBR
MGDARTKRREQLKRWAGSSTDRASDVPRLRRQGDVKFDIAAEFLAACASGDTEEAKDTAAIINCSNADGITALHQACIDGSIEMVTFLLEQGASVNQVDNEGWTALHVAASCGHADITECVQ